VGTFALRRFQSRELVTTGGRSASEPLMRVAVQAAAFFEMCPHDVLDPDAGRRLRV
jgi:hypothetical protein